MCKIKPCSCSFNLQPRNTMQLYRNAHDEQLQTIWDSISSNAPSNCSLQPTPMDREEIQQQTHQRCVASKQNKPVIKTTSKTQFKTAQRDVAAIEYSSPGHRPMMTIFLEFAQFPIDLRENIGSFMAPHKRQNADTFENSTISFPELFARQF